MHTTGLAQPTGALSLKVIRAGERNPQAPGRAWPSATALRSVAAYGMPQRGLDDEINLWRTRNLRNLQRGLRRVLAARAFQVPTVFGALWLEKIEGETGRRIPYGLASMRVVTDAGVGAIVDAFQNLVEPENFKFHGFGTGGTAEAASQTALTTELTTQYATDNTRPTGSQTENGANVYRTVATLDPDADVAITEHGLFTQAATGGGTMLDRSLFSAVNLVGATGDALQATYDFTITSGG